MSKIIDKIDSFLLEKDESAAAMEVAREIHKQRRGKEDDIPPRAIEAALKKKMGKGGLKHFDEVKAWLKKKGYKIWVKKTLRGFGQR